MADETNSDDPVTGDAGRPGPSRDQQKKADAHPAADGTRHTVRELLSVPREELTDEEREGLDRLGVAARAIGDAASAGLRESVASLEAGLVTGPYADIVASFMKDRDDALAASAAFDPGDDGYVIAPPDHYELEALQQVASGVDTVATNLLEVIAAQKTTADAQKLAADQLLHVGELLGALDATIRTGDRSNGRLGKIAIAIAVVSLVVAAIIGIIPLVGP